MLRSHKLTGSLYIGIGLLSAVTGIIVGHDALAGVGVVFFCIGAVLLGNAARHSTNRPDTSAKTQAHRHGHVLPP